MIEDYFFTKNTKWVVWGAVVVIAGLLIFHAGVVVGSHQVERGRFGPGSRGGMLGGFMPERGFVESRHGAVGMVATVTLPTFTLQTRDGAQERIETGTSTVVTGGPLGTTEDLTTGLMVIVIGDPKQTDEQDSQNDLDARIIHILPPPPANDVYQQQ